MKITDKIHLLKIDFDIALGPDKKISRFVNVILVLCEKITLIDTGVKGSEEIISEYLKQYNRDLSEIGTIILSHSHPDHIGSAARIKELAGCRVLAHELERDWIENIQKQNTERPVPGFYNLVDTPVQLDGFLSGDQEMTADKDITLKFIHSPGHSKGSLNILLKKIRFCLPPIPSR